MTANMALDDTAIVCKKRFSSSATAHAAKEKKVTRALTFEPGWCGWSTVYNLGLSVSTCR